MIIIMIFFLGQTTALTNKAEYTAMGLLWNVIPLALKDLILAH